MGYQSPRSVSWTHSSKGRHLHSAELLFSITHLIKIHFVGSLNLGMDSFNRAKMKCMGPKEWLALFDERKRIDF